MKRVLLVAYYFPPLGGAGVQRSVKFVQYLPRFGYDPVVVTGPKARSLSWAPADYTLADALPAGTNIRRLPGAEPPRSTGGRGRAERWLRLQSTFSRWWIEEAVAAGYQTGEGVDIICASMSPFASGEAAARLARELHTPWVADLRDPWALDEWQIYPTALHRILELSRMRSVLSAADAIVMNTPEATLQLRKHFPEFKEKLVVTIPNGFDPADFEGPAPPRDDGTFRIVHAGYVHTESGVRHRRMRLPRRLLGGAVKGLNVLARSHVHLLEAVDHLLAVEPDLRSIVEVHLAGVMSEQARNAVRSDVVRTHGYLSHPEVIALIRTADLLFLPLHDLPLGRRATTVPGKTYEYLASNRPVLAAVPDGDMRDLLQAATGTLVCRPTDVTCLAQSLREQIHRWRVGGVEDVDRHELLAPYERRNLTRDLAQTFDSILTRSQTNTIPGKAAQSIVR